ncbi:MULTISPECIES: hypothetical protein [unclassified Bradyrhizobium]|uniref:hypothetical protein n=1 Tax=unclassified Bradyrhizobium TaxID=2631580 RepID=UPI0030D4CDFC
MADQQDTNSKGHAGPGESLEDGAQNQASQVSPAADALSEGSLDDVSGGGWPLNTFSSSVYRPTNGG